MKRSVGILAAAIAVVLPVSVAGIEEAAHEPAQFDPLKGFLRDQSVSSVLRTDYFQSSKTLDDAVSFWGTTAQIKALSVFTDTIDGKFEGRITNPDVVDEGDTETRLLEGYVTMHFLKADLRIGKQIVPWGRADGINPTDNLTPRDYTVMLPFEEDQRFGTTALKVDTYLSQEYSLSVFTTPFFTPSKIPLSDDSTVIEMRPASDLSNSEIGIRLNKVGGDLDWSASYFRGFSLLPNMRFISSTPMGPILELHYPRITVLGADFARNYGRFGFRGEVAYVDSADDHGEDPTVKNPYLFWIAGVDRTFFENLNVNLQFFQRRVRYFRNPEDIADPLEHSVAIQNAIIDGERDRISNGISFRVSNKWLHDTLEAELFCVYNLTRNDRFWRPLLSYAFDDHWKGTLGGEFYRGADDTQYGSLKSNRGVFAELRYGFER